MLFTELLKTRTNADKVFASKKNTLDNGDIGNTMITEAVRLVNKLIEPTKAPEADQNAVMVQPSCIRKGTDNVSVPEEYVGKVDELVNAEYKNAMDKFIKITSSQMEEVWKNDIDEQSKTKIYESLKTLADQIVQQLLNEGDECSMAYIGHSVYDIPVEKKQDMISYSKQKLQEMAYDLAKDLTGYITSKKQQIQPPVGDPVPMQQPLVMQYGTPMPDYSQESDIMKHFMITPNVQIYDPYSYESFKTLLKSLAQQLDQKDKELGLTKPSKFAFEQFFGTTIFKITRIDENGQFYNPNDTANFMCIWTDSVGQIQFTGPAVQAATA